MAKLTDRQKQKRYCPRCRSDFYNGQNPYEIKKCWHLDSSRVEWRDIYLTVHSKKTTRKRALNCYTPQY